MLDEDHIGLLPSLSVRAELRSIVASDRRLSELARPIGGRIDDAAIVDVRNAAGARVYQMVHVPVPGTTGRFLASRMPGYGPDAAARMDALYAWGVDRVVCLVPSMDFRDVCGCPEYGELARARWGDGFAIVDVVDYEAPPDDAPFEDAVDATLTALRSGLDVLVHCVMGCGRTGMFGSCVLVAAGMDPVDAISHFREVRRCGPESTDQLAYVVRYASRLQARRPRPSPG